MIKSLLAGSLIINIALIGSLYLKEALIEGLEPLAISCVQEIKKRDNEWSYDYQGLMDKNKQCKKEKKRLKTVLREFRGA